jgi:uncharacterized protein involved in outer membrane biogenesis
MQKKSLVLLLVIAVLLFLVYYSFNLFVRKTLEARLTQAIGLRTRIDSLRAFPLQGKLSIKKLTIDNPEGFKNRHLFTLKSGIIYMDVFSQLQNIISIDAIKLRGVKINAEHGTKGFNLDYVKKVVRSDSNRKEHKADEIKERPAVRDKNEERSNRRYSIGSLSIKKIEVLLSSESIGIKSINFKLPDVILEKLSEPSEDPITLDELLYRILSVIIDKLAAQSPETYQNTIKKFLMEQLQNFYKR